MGEVILLGSSGFIGSHLEKKLKKKFSVTSFSSKECNLLDQKSIQHSLAFITEQDTLIICSSITRLVDNSYESMNKNIQMALNLASFLSSQKAKQVIFLSTIDVYGISINEKCHENTPLNPNDYYATSKVTSELILTQVCKEQNIKLFIPRLSGVFGANDINKSTIYHLVSCALQQRVIRLYNKGEAYRDFIHIDYVTDIISNAILNHYEGILNIAMGKSFRISKVSELICKALNKEQPIKIMMMESHENSRVNNLHFNIEKLKKSGLLNTSSTFESYLNSYISDFNNK